jgi:GLPGLI family protein
MKKISFIILLTNFFVFSQNYKVSYNLEQTAKNINLKTSIKTYLEGNGLFSLYEEDFENSRTNSNSENEVISINKNPILFKDIKNNKTYFKDHIRFKFFNIIDEGYSLNWVLENETKKILNYNCQKASCYFRGRKFDVYFSTELPFNDGPWKLNGLPGLILEVYSDDEAATFHFIVEKIEINKEFDNLKNPYSEDKTIPYSEYIKIYKEKYEESLHKIVNENGETRPMPKGFREYYVD